MLLGLLFKQKLHLNRVVIQAKVAFKRILKFLEAPELQSANVRRKTTAESVNVAISIKSDNFAWEENSSKPTLRDINLEVRHGSIKVERLIRKP
jgi:ATP-binding cassette subfamily C (CFTR/MRP) protein 2